jgi:hypothetical protein
VFNIVRSLVGFGSGEEANISIPFEGFLEHRSCAFLKMENAEEVDCKIDG